MLFLSPSVSAFCWCPSASAGHLLHEAEAEGVRKTALRFPHSLLWETILRAPFKLLALGYQVKQKSIPENLFSRVTSTLSVSVSTPEYQYLKTLDDVLLSFCTALFNIWPQSVALPH